MKSQFQEMVRSSISRKRRIITEVGKKAARVGRLDDLAPRAYVGETLTRTFNAREGGQ
jgi:hypothetical protein